MSKVKVRIKKTPTRLMCLFTLLLTVTVLCSCNVTRSVTTKSEYMQRGDTSVTIITKTIESYDASKKL